MSKKEKQARKELITKALSNQRQYDLHQEKIKDNPHSHAIEHWKKEKANFISRYIYYISNAKVKNNDPIE